MTLNALQRPDVIKQHKVFLLYTNYFNFLLFLSQSIITNNTRHYLSTISDCYKGLLPALKPEFSFSIIIFRLIVTSHLIGCFPVIITAKHGF